jgi:hypothetical protein
MEIWTVEMKYFAWRYEKVKQTDVVKDLESNLANSFTAFMVRGIDRYSIARSNP